MTIEEFLARMQAGKICACRTPEQRNEVLTFLKDRGFSINGPSLAYLEPGSYETYYLNPGMNSSGDTICCYSGSTRSSLTYDDFLDALYGAEPDDAWQDPPREAELMDFLGFSMKGV